MFWIPIAFIVLCFYAVKGFSTGVSHVRASNAAARVNAEQSSFKSFTVPTYEEELELQKTFKWLIDDVFEFLGREPSEEERRAFDGLGYIQNRDYLHLLCKMAPLGKLPRDSIHGQGYPTKDKTVRRVIEEVYLKAEQCLRERGIPTAVYIDRIPPSNGATQSYALDDLARGGSPCTTYGDKLCWANYSFYQPVRNMIR